MAKTKKTNDAKVSEPVEDKTNAKAPDGGNDAPVTEDTKAATPEPVAKVAEATAKKVKMVNVIGLMRVTFQHGGYRVNIDKGLQTKMPDNVALIAAQKGFIEIVTAKK